MLNKYIEKIILLKRSVGENLITLGGLLHDLKENEYYKEQSETFEEFLALPEISFSRATAYKAMRIYEAFVLQAGQTIESIADIDCDKLALIAGPVANSPEKITDYLSQARMLSRSDLRVELGRPTSYQTLEQRVIAFLDIIQPDHYVPDMRKKNGWAKAFKKLIMEWENYKHGGAD